MSHSPGRRKIDRYYAQLRDEKAARKAAEAAAEKAFCTPIVRAWNAHSARRWPPRFYPTIGAALAGGAPILSYMCPGCQQVGDVDLRELDRHPGATIASVIPSLSCARCCPNPPFARLLSLASTRPSIKAKKARSP